MDGVTRRFQPGLTIALPVLALGAALLVAIAIPRVGLTLGIVLLATPGLLAVWAFAATRGALAPTLYTTGFVLVTLVPDVALNAGVQTQWLALVALHAGLLLWHGRAHLEARDVAVLLMLAGAVFPALVSSELAIIPGTLLAFAAPYSLGRVWQPGRWRVVRLLLVVGSIHGFIAIGHYVPELRLIVQSALSGTQGSGLFNNPNTLGVRSRRPDRGVRRRRSAAMVAAGGAVPDGTRPELQPGGAGSARRRRRGDRDAVPAPVRRPRVRGGHRRGDRHLSSADAARATGPDDVLIGPRSARAIWHLVGGHRPHRTITLDRLCATLPAVVDQAFLGWLLAGGVISLVAWVGGIVLLAGTARVWPIVLAMVAVAFLANPFSGAHARRAPPRRRVRRGHGWPYRRSRTSVGRKADPVESISTPDRDREGGIPRRTD